MSQPFRIALVTTQYSPISHADVIVSRWLEPRATDAAYGWSTPKTKIASMYVDQILENDISGDICRKHGVPRFSTVEKALTLDGNDLAVDAVLLIAEHGDYPRNEWGQKLYPRRELFDQVISVFRKSGRVVPLFFDKHLSWDPVAAHRMYWTLRELSVPFFGGSSIPHSPRSATLPTADGRPREMVCFYFNELEDYLFHSLEYARSVLEDFTPAPSQVSSITAWKDGGVWDSLESGIISPALFQSAAQAVSDTSAAHLDHLRKIRGGPIYAFQLRYEDGLKETHVMQDHVRKWSLALKCGDPEQSGAAYALSGGAAEFYPHFTRLNCLIEKFFLTREMPVPLERLYLTTLATAACMHALSRPGREIPLSSLRLPVPAAAPADAVWNG